MYKLSERERGDWKGVAYAVDSGYQVESVCSGQVGRSLSKADAVAGASLTDSDEADPVEA